MKYRHLSGLLSKCILEIAECVSDVSLTLSALVPHIAGHDRRCRVVGGGGGDSKSQLAGYRPHKRGYTKTRNIKLDPTLAELTLRHSHAKPLKGCGEGCIGDEAFNATSGLWAGVTLRLCTFGSIPDLAG